MAAASPACTPDPRHAPLPQVLIEGVRVPGAVAREAGSTPALEVQFQVHFGVVLQQCEAFAARCRSDPCALLGGEQAEVHALLGQPDAATVTAVCEAISATADAVGSAHTAGEAAIAKARQARNEQRVVPARPLKDMELPYKMYRVRSATLLGGCTSAAMRFR
jgi:hypothetical protein